MGKNLISCRGIPKYYGTDKDNPSNENINTLGVVKRVSKWITIKTDYNITKRHSLWYYASKEDECCSVQYIPFNGRKYAVDQFVLMNGVWCMQQFYWENNEWNSIHAYDSEGNVFDPYMVQFNQDCTKARFYLSAFNTTRETERYLKECL